MGSVADAPSLDFAYKLTEYQGRPRLKTSPGKPLYPGAKQVWRFSDGDGGCRYDEITGRDEARDGVPLLRPVVANGEAVAPLPDPDQARQLGVKATILEAGGYTEAAKQVSQYNDCVALGVDAIVIGAISEAGLAKSMAEGNEKGIVQVGVINPMSDVAGARIFANYDDAAEAGAKFLADMTEGKPMRMVHFPGPQGSGWAEASTEGVERGIEGSGIELLEAKYGDTGKSIQLRLVEDALQAYDDVNIIYGTAVTAEVAKQALEEAGNDDALIAAYYSNEGMVDLVKSGVVTATVTESPVMEARIAMDLAVRILEGKDHLVELNPSMTVLTKDNIDSFDMSRSFAPADWEPVYAVE